MKLLPVGAGYLAVTGGVAKPWGNDASAWLRAEAGWHPLDNLTTFGFAQADNLGAQAGLGARLTW